MNRFAPVLLGLLLSAAACGTQTQPIGIVVSSNGSLEVGQQRCRWAGRNRDPGLPGFARPGGHRRPGRAQRGDDRRRPPRNRLGRSGPAGLYRTTIDFLTAGGWSITISADGYAATEPTRMMVADDTAMPQVGEVAPTVATRTGSQFPLEEITTDPAPEPSFYELSLDEALPSRSRGVISKSISSMSRSTRTSTPTATRTWSRWRWTPGRFPQNPGSS